MSGSLRALLEVCEDAGLARRTLLEGAGLTTDEVDDPDARVPAEKAGRVWEVAERLTRNPALALDAAGVLPIGSYGVVDYLIRYSNTVGDGFERLARHFALIAEPVGLAIETGPELCTLSLRSLDKISGVPARFATFSLASIVIRTRRSWECNWRPMRVGFRFPVPACADRYRAVFQCPVLFGGEIDGLVVSRETWDAALPKADPGLSKVLDSHAEALLRSLPPRGDLIAVCRRHVWAALQGGDCSIGAVSRSLGMSRRSLQRRLADCGTSYAQVVGEVRSELAQHYLSERDLAIAEIASLLGFSDQSSFHRAFKRWTGRTPREHRQASTAERRRQETHV